MNDGSERSITRSRTGPPTFVVCDQVTPPSMVRRTSPQKACVDPALTNIRFGLLGSIASDVRAQPTGMDVQGCHVRPPSRLFEPEVERSPPSGMVSRIGTPKPKKVAQPPSNESPPSSLRKNNGCRPLHAT